MNDLKAPFIGISRHRLQTDGDGVTTLCCFHNCPLRCKYCLNPQCYLREPKFYFTPFELYEKVKIDDLYFLATEGGITFGGGEPLLYADFISEFRYICGDKWKIYIETSLNVPFENLKKIMAVADYLFIDIKDMNSDIYKNYTGKSNELVLKNLEYLSKSFPLEKIKIRLPLIKEFNDDNCRENSKKILSQMGFNNFDLFEYKVRNCG